MLDIKGPRVLVKQDKLEDKDPTFAKAAKAGIEIPQEFKEIRMEQNAIDEGVVVGVGQGCWQPPIGDGTPWCEIGDRVVFAKYAGSIRKEGKDTYMILNDEDILGVVHE